MRRFQIPIAGRWYFGLMIMTGGVSLTSLNNVVYLMESLLISALLVSAVLSYRVGRSVTVEVRRRGVRAAGVNHDLVQLVNRSRFPAFCVEIDEWTEGKPRRLAFVPYIKARSTLRVDSHAVYERRGIWNWDEISVSTTFPYGFLRFISSVPRKGSRIIWPASARASGQGMDRLEGQAQNAGGTAVLEGEVRPMNYDDDPRTIVWTLSARGGDLMVRMRAAEKQLRGLSLDLRTEAGEAFEATISSLATQVYEHPEAEEDAIALTVFDSNGRKRIYGRHRVLDCLALARAEGGKEAA